LVGGCLALENFMLPQISGIAPENNNIAGLQDGRELPPAPLVRDPKSSRRNKRNGNDLTRKAFARVHMRTDETSVGIFLNGDLASQRVHPFPGADELRQFSKP